MTAADLRALARRVCDEPPSRELDRDIARILVPADAEDVARSSYGWSYRVFGPSGWDEEWVDAKPYTTSLDAAASLMPEGWRNVSIELGCGEQEDRCCCMVYDENQHIVAAPHAPTEAQARTAAALLAMAADLEARDDQ